MGHHNCRPGFLLMEALAAIFLLAIFSMVVGGYWQAMATARSTTQHRMQALALAADFIDRCCAQQLSWDAIPATSGPFTIAQTKQSIDITSNYAGIAQKPSLITLTLSWQEMHQRHEVRCKAIA